MRFLVTLLTLVLVVRADESPIKPENFSFDKCDDSKDPVCIANNFCHEAGIDCDGILRSLVTALSNNAGNVVSYTTIFVTIIVLLKLVIVALSWLVAHLHCKRKRDRKRAISELAEINLGSRV